MKKLSEWLAATAPLKAIEACSICSKIPTYCSRFEKGGELVADDIPDEVKRLEAFLGPLPHYRGDVMRCPECHRPYYYESEYEFLVGGSEDTWSYRRYEPEELFRDSWFIRYRIGEGLDIGSWLKAFPHHAIARMRDGTWFALHDEGERTPLASSADLRALGPSGLNEEDTARGYLGLVERIDNLPANYGVRNFNHIQWKWTLTDDEKRQIEDLRGASRVRDEEVERVADRVLVKRWFVDKPGRRLVYRIINIFPDGTIQNEDAVIGEDLPLMI